MKFSLIAAVDGKFGLGKNNTLPWRLPADLKHFSSMTTETKNTHHINAVIMGRKTWDSLPPKSRPLKDRLNLVLTKSLELNIPEGVLIASSLDEALAKVQNKKIQLKIQPQVENIFVIGGARVFAEAINHPDCEKIYLTHIEGDFTCDTFFPSIDPAKFELLEKGPTLSENGIDFQFSVYKKKLTI